MFLSLPSQSSVSKLLKVEKEAGTYYTKPFSVFTGGAQTHQNGNGREEDSTVILLAPSSMHAALINSVTSAFLDEPNVKEQGATSNFITYREAKSIYERMAGIVATDLGHSKRVSIFGPGYYCYRLFSARIFIEKTTLRKLARSREQVFSGIQIIMLCFR